MLQTEDCFCCNMPAAFAMVASAPLPVADHVRHPAVAAAASLAALCCIQRCLPLHH
jgi:hypothetical protein